MPNPPLAVRSLESLCNSHAVFKPDQVLSHEQLNSLAEYLDEQGRLTRVRLIGTGIVEGLNVRIDAGGITISRGLGITPDGDLVVKDDEKPFTHAKAYLPATQTTADYPPFRTPTKLELHELLTEDVPGSVRLADLPNGLNDRGVIAYVESRVGDSDLCTGVDCDNHGERLVHTLRFLLVTPLSSLAAGPSTVATAARGLPSLTVRRAPLGAGAISATTLAAAFAGAVDASRAEFDAAMDQFDTRLGAFASTVTMPGGDAKLRGLWDAAMSGAVSAASINSATQLGPALTRHRFLRDIADAWNELREALLEVDVLLENGDPANAKHLVLAGTAASRLTARSRFIPAQTARAARGRARAEFRLSRLAALLRTFSVPNPAGPLVITPGRGERSELGARVLPSHYVTAAGVSPSEWWSERARLEGGPPVVGPRLADSALTRSPAWALARFRAADDFFAIDGVRGQSAAAVVADLKAKIAEHDLPFAVIAVSLGTKVEDIVLKPPIRYGDLHRLHKLIRFQLANQVRRTDDFLRSFVTKVDRASDERVIDLGVDGRTKLVQHRDQVTAASTVATTAVTSKATYAEARGDTTLLDSVSLVRDQSLTGLSLLDNYLDKIHITPADPLAVRLFDDWPRWLEQLADQREQSLNEGLLLAKFLVEHPSLEHLGGVERGGTLVLVYGTGGNVLADFALPYRVVDHAEADPAGPTLTADPPAGAAPPIGGLVLRPSRDRWFEEKEIKIRRDLSATSETAIDDRFQSMKRSNEFFFSSFQGTLQKFVAPAPTVTTPAGGGFIPTDPVVTAPYNVLLERKEKVRKARELLESPELSDTERKSATKKLVQAEGELVTGASNVVQAVINVSTAAGPTSDGERLLKEVAASATMLTSQESRKKLAESIESAANGTPNTAVKVRLGELTSLIKGL